MPEDYYKDGYFYYYRHTDGDWQVARLQDGKFEVGQGLFSGVEDLVDQCGVVNVIRIPQPEDLK